MSTSTHPELPQIPKAFDWKAFRANAHQTIDLIIDYHESLAQQKEEQVAGGGTVKTSVVPVQSQVQPGYLIEALPKEAPEEPVEWEVVNKELKDLIIPGMTHWQHPNFFAYFPALLSPPALLGDLVSNALNQPGFTWVCSPAATELEMVTMEWVRKAFQLPEKFSWQKGEGGCMLQPTASEAITVNILAARNRILTARGLPSIGTEAVYTAAQEQQKNDILSKLVVYFSDQSHFCVEKAAKVLAICHVRSIPSTGGLADGNRPMSVERLEKTILEDQAAGLIPCFVSANYGATGVCAVDDLKAVATVAQKYKLWYNVDAAYAGVAAMLSEVQAEGELKGIEEADSVLINGSKWFSTMFNCAFLFFGSRKDVVASLNATGTYLENEQTTEQKVFDLKDYQLGLGRPFRSLKLFTTLRSFGLDGMRATIRRHMMLAQYSAEKLRASGKINVTRVKFGLVCFQIIEDAKAAATQEAKDAENTKLLNLLNQEKDLYLVHTVVDGLGTVIRLSLAHPTLDVAKMDEVCDKIVAAANEVRPSQ